MPLHSLRLASFLLLTLGLSAPTLATEAGARPLVVVLDDNYPPYVFRGPDGQVQGYLVDSWQLWARKTGVAVDLRAEDWALAQRDLAEGRAQVIDTMFRTPEREATLDFSAPYADIPVHIYVHKDIGGIRDLASLRTFVVGVKQGDACEGVLLAAGVSRLQPLPSYAALVEAAKDNTLRMFCMDGPPADFLLYRAGLHREFRAALSLSQGQFHRAVRKGDQATLAEVEKGFAAFTPDELAGLRRQWLSPSERVPAPWEHYLGAIALVAALGGAVVLGWGIALRRVVDRRTAELNTQRRQLETLISTLPDLVFVKDLAGRYLTCNPAFAERHGREVQDIVGKTDADLMPEAEALLARQRDREALQHGHRTLAEEWLQTPGQDEAGLFEVIRTPLRDHAQHVVGVVGIARDVTQYRQNEERLSRLNRLYRVLARVQEASALTRDAVTLFGVVCGALKSEGSLYEAWIGQADAAEDWLLPVAHAGFIAPPSPVPLRQDPPGSLEAQAWQQGATLVEHLLDDPEALGDTRVALVLRVGSQRRALLCITGDRLGTEETALLERLAGQVSLALAAAEAETTRRVAVAALQDSEMRFAQMFQTSPVGMLLCRANDLHVVDVNAAWLELFGQRIDEVIGHGVTELGLLPDATDPGDALSSTLTDGRRVKGRDLRLLRRNGELVDIAFSATRMSIGAQDYLLASFVDITYQKLATRQLEAEAELLEREVARRTAELNSLFEALPDLYFRLSPDGRMLDARAGNTADLLRPAHEQIGLHVDEVLPPQAAQVLQAGLHRAVRQHQPVTVEYEVTTGQGPQAFEARLVPAGEDVVAVVRNVSERHALEAEREAARELAERQARHRSEFLANMSHEIRTPLNAILGFAQLGLEQARGTPAEPSYQRILEAGRLLLGIINDVLDFSKIEAERLDVESIPANPRQLIEASVDMIREGARAKGLSLQIALADSLPDACLTDPLRLQQILANLLSNALKFTSTGRIEVRAEVADEQLVITVSDTGIGMSAEQLDQLFAPFHQADASTTRRYGGTGLGLTISRRLAELMGGEIQVSSQLGQGSRFTLRLPLRPAAMATLPLDLRDPAPPAGHQPLQGLRLLVAEDNEVNQLVIEQALRGAGAEVVLAPNGREAVNRVRAEPTGFDAVLMDIQMPEMDGFEATRRLRVIAPRLPVIGQTAHALAAEREQCLACGMVAHVAKPIDIGRLIATLQAVTRQPGTAPATC
ncbi:PAS domain-containing protein [Ideonella sp. B7]|uniref:ATP-binding protein n=1 Tax=Ideonella benzenivorans TaxID=2831643 RepID=UPI001CEDCF7B|nr:ATP-binding protein [Ideonella benzenivorans]MCA6218068.1 PAS domain-containing protein [Ideonella benzenivorans]